jgi:hypothetical protein
VTIRRCWLPAPEGWIVPGQAPKPAGGRSKTAVKP